MAARSRGYNQDWDSMQEEFDSGQEPQTSDDRSSLDVLDHCRLHITNIPRALTQDGMYTAFSRFGNLVECFVSADPEKRYALVSFETPGEAKLAMMKLNRTEPLNLYVNIAYKRGPKRQNDSGGHRSSNPTGARKNRDERGLRENANGSSGHRPTRSIEKRQEMANGDSTDTFVDDDGLLNNSMEPDLNLELEQLKLVHLKLQEEQLLCKKRMLMLRQTERKSTRSLMSDDRTVRVINSGDRDGTFSSGGGDATNIPGLQSVAVCVACGDRAESFCSGCGMTAYCSQACQRRDWTQRHMKVCHNLKRQSGGAVTRARADPEPAPVVETAPLRRPRSPQSDRGDKPQSRRIGPPGHANNAAAPAAGRNSRTAQPDNRRVNRTFEGADDRPDSRTRNPQERHQVDNSNDKYCRKNMDYNRPRNQDGDNRRYQNAGRSENRDEDWAPKPQQRAQEAKPAAQPKKEATPRSAPVTRATPATPATPTTPVAPAAPTVAHRPIATVADVSPKPVNRSVPKNCVAELLPLEATFMLMVDAVAQHTARGGMVCTLGVPDGIHADNYVRLLEPFASACAQAQTFLPVPGDVFGYLDPSDGEWYRARCFAPSRAALVDASRLVTFTPKDKCARLTREFADLPEYSCHLEADNVNVHDTLECTVISKSDNALTVSMISEGSNLGPAVVRRWLPTVEPVETAEAAKSSNSQNSIEIPRPPVTNNSRVLLVSASEPSSVAVRSAARGKMQEYDNLVDDIAECGAKARNKLRELPVQGQLVLAHRSDQHDAYYRAVVKRVSKKHGKCLLEFTELGDSTVESKLDNMCPCPSTLDMETRPPLVSLVSLPMKPKSFSDSALEYIRRLSDDDIELELTIVSGAESGPSGTAVLLQAVSSRENVNRTLQDLSTPEWQKLMDKGKTVFDVEDLHYNILEHVDPPPSGDFEIVDCSDLVEGLVYGFAKDSKHGAKALALTPRLEEYCNSALAKDPYLPKSEYLCIARCPIRDQWLRAVNLSQEGGPGSLEVKVNFVDYGFCAEVPVTSLRKMMPEFVRGLPAASCHLVIKDFPPNPTAEQLERAKSFMNYTDTVPGTLTVKKCRTLDCESIIEVPELIRAMS